MDPSLDENLQEITHEITALGRNLAIAALVLGGGLVLSRVLRGFIQGRTAFRQLPVVGQTLILNGLTFVIGLLACTVVLVLWGVTWSTIATGIGLSTLAIALGLQDVLKSLAGGVVIMLERPFDIGDRIRIKDLTGEVVDIRVRHVVLRMDDGHVAMAPNGLLFSEPYENFSHQEGYLYSISISNLPEPADAARETIKQTLARIEGLQDTPDIQMHWDLRRVIPWSRGDALGEAYRHPRSRQQAIVSWRSKSKETAISELVHELQARFPEAVITVRRR